MSIRKLSFNNAPYQSFIFKAGIAGELKIIFAWNTLAKYWSMEVYDNLSGGLLQGGFGVVAGANLFTILPPYNLAAILLNKNNIIKDPTRNTLSDCYIYIGGADEFQ